MLLHEKEGRVFDVLKEENLTPEDVTYSIKFPALKTMTPVEESKKNLMAVQTVAKELEIGSMTIDEARKMLHPDWDDLEPESDFEPKPEESLQKFLSELSDI